MEKRPFGKTGVELPVLSLGCQRLVDEKGCSMGLPLTTVITGCQ